MVRKAKFGDIPRLAALLEQAYRRSKYSSRTSVNAKDMKAILVTAIQRHGLASAGGNCVFVSEHEGVVDGLIAASLDPVYYIGESLWANEVFFYVAPDGSPASAGDLIDAYVDWVQGIEAVIVQRLAATDIIDGVDYERTAALYRRKGFVQTGVIYERRNDL